MPDVRRPTIWLLLGLGVLLWGGEYVLRGLWEPDEARYAYVAREMQEGDHWFVPHLHGEPYPDKPPLPFWLTNVAALPFGGAINGISARLPTFFAAVLILWLTARLLERWRDPATAWRGVWVLLTCYLFWHEGGWGRIDMLLTAFEMAAVYLLLTYNDTQRTWRALLAYGCIGLAILAKGPVGLAIPLGIYLAATWATGDQRLLRRWHWAWGIPLALLLPGLWLLAAWLQHPPAEYFGAMFGSKSFGRVIKDHHAQPVYYYLTTFPADFLPWMLFLPGAIVGLGRGVVRRRLLAWLLFVFVLFTLFVGKRNVYLLPMFPAAAMVVAAGWDGMQRLSRWWSLIPGWIALAILFVLGAGLFGGMFSQKVPFATWRLLPAALVALAGSAFTARLFLREGLSARWCRTYAGSFFLLWISLSTLVLPALNPLKAPLELTAEARARLAPDQPIYLYQDQLAIIALYADRPGRYLRTPEEVEARIATGAYGIIVFDQEDWDTLGPQFADRVRARPFKMGSKHLVWVDFPPPDAGG
jgi:4-amino-4-deoxy-L-arabinose transferase-like glycosyltransferase